MTTLLMCCCDSPCTIESYVNTGHGCGCYNDEGCEDGEAASGCLTGETFTVEIATVRTSRHIEADPDCSGCGSCEGGDCCCEQEDCNCLYYYSAQTETITVGNFSHVSSGGCGGAYESTVSFTIPKASEHNDDPDDPDGEGLLSTDCCSDVNANDWPLDDDCAYGGCLGGASHGLPYYERGVRTAYGMCSNPDLPCYYEHISYSNQIPDRDGVTLSLVFRAKTLSTGCTMYLKEVRGPIGFDYNETFNEDGLIYSYGATPDQDWPVPDRGQSRVMAVSQSMDVASSGEPCYCGWAPSTNVWGQGMYWYASGDNTDDLTDGVRYWEDYTYPQPLLYQTTAVCCLPGCEAPEGMDCSGYMRLRVQLGPMQHV